MKSSRPLGVLAALTLAASSAVALQSAPAAAATCSSNVNDPADNVLTVTNTTPTLPGGTILLSGQCFAPGQRLAVKIDRDDYGQIGADEDEDPGPETTRSRIEVGPDGSFSNEAVVVPRYTAGGVATRAGSHLVFLLDNDPVTSVNAPFDTRADFTTAATVTDAAVSISGIGWLDRAGTGPSTVAVQIESLADGTVLRRATGHAPDASRPDVWAYVPVAVDGSIAGDVALPDGTTAGARGTATRFVAGDYVVRVRSGYGLAAAGTDITRSVQLTDAPFALTPAADVVPALTGVAVSGTAKVGAKLTARATVAPAGAAVSYQWLRNGVAIAGAKSVSYTASVADFNTSLSVTVSALNGAASASVTSKAVKVGAASAKAGTVKITGKAKVGKTLKVKTSKWAAGTKLSYKWTVGGKTVKGATKSKIKVKKSWKGKKVTVKVTGKKTGYVTVAKSAKTAKVTK